MLTERQSGTDEDSIVRGAEYVKLAVRIARELTELVGQSPRLYVMTRNAQTVLTEDRPNLEQGGLRGLLRVIGAEHPHSKVSYIDVDDQTGTEHVARQLLLATDEDETAWRDDQWYTARLYPSPLRPEERHNTVVDHKEQGMRLQVRTPGDLQTMEFTAFDRVPPGPNEIEVAVSASSINFADVLAAYGRCPTFDGKQPPLGLDFAGVVTAVGPEVSDHQVGDHVGGLSPDGCWSTFVTCDARLATKLPDGLTDAQAAAVTTASATAWFGLQDLARIRAGDKVLIHSGTGGVGQAAIAIARAAGAEIYATAGSEKRRQLLRDMGIEHVYDSRSVEFAEQIRRDTDGYGVDIVLNSVTGAAQLAGIKLLAMGGRFVEIGKLDIYGDTKVGLFPFRQNLAFYGVDLALMSRTHPAQVRGLLNTVYQQTANGVLPLPEATHYPLAEAATAVRVMGAAEHTGKLILDIPHTGRSSVVLPPEHAQVFRGDSSYIITGGLGGLGLFLAEKMASAGAGRIVLSSRSQPSQKALETIELIRAIGSEVVVECGDIAEAGYRRKAGGHRHRDRSTAARGAARGRGDRRRHLAQYHRQSSSTGTGRPRCAAPGICTRPCRRLRPTSRWTGSARSPRRQPWPAHRVKAPMPRPTAGWTPSPSGGVPRVCPPARSPGAPGARSAAARRSPKPPGTRSNPRKAPTRSRRCCGTTARTPAMRRSSDRRG